MKANKNIFSLKGKVAMITGGAGMLGVKHAEAILEMQGIPVLSDINDKAARDKAEALSRKYNSEVLGLKLDVTDIRSIKKLLETVLDKFGHVDILINNAANNPKVKGKTGKTSWSRFENFPLELWNKDLDVCLTGAFLCSQIIGRKMAEAGKGVIVNISSDLGVIAPDNRIYTQPNLPESKQSVKPVSYSVVKFGIIGLTKYLAAYWAEKGVRVNSLSPGGIYDGQSDEFVQKLSHLIPLKRMANSDEYKGAIIFLCSDASSYMTGANLIIDGGRTCW